MLDPASVPLAALALLALVPQDANDKARKLFLANCATCHGETGDGQGVTKLDRPARSFKDGGFSFGNTPEQLFKTISTGIPGSPMAGFDASLSEDDRRLLAGYVVTLGPPIEEVKLEDTILTVRDRPLVVRGLLPALGEGLPQHPRGLLVGDPSGITFEYTVDDVRLLALRQGGFVERTDWSGRGGTPLNPLGKVVHLIEGGKPEATFSLQGAPLEARLSGTREQGAITIEYHLVRDHREVAHVSETPRVATKPFGTGYARAFVVVNGGTRSRLALADPTQTGGEELLARQKRVQDSFVGTGQAFASVRRSPDRPVELRVVWLPAAGWVRQGGLVSFDLEPGQRVVLGVGTIPLGEWNDAVQKQVEGDLR